MRIIGQILLWTGFLGGAFCAVLRTGLPEGSASESDWAIIPWAWYVVSVGVGAAGVVLLRLANSGDNQSEEATEVEYATIQSNLFRVSTVVERLCEMPLGNPGAVVSAIDNECVAPLADFANARQALVKRFGMNVYAEVMTEFASAERFLNRAWSAAADGYVDEVSSCLHRAKTHLGETREIMSAAENQLRDS